MLMGSKAVFMIGWEYPPHNSGGLGVACQGMTEALAEQNTHIYFTLPHQQAGGTAHMDMLNCSDPRWFGTGQDTQPPFIAYSSVSPHPHRIAHGMLDQHKLHQLPQSELEAKVDRYAELVAAKGIGMEDHYDVIHAHDWMSFPAAMQLQKATRKPFIAHVHSTELDRIPNGYGSSYITATEYAGMKAATRVIAVSYYTKQLLVNEYAIDPNKIDVVHNGISPFRYMGRSPEADFAKDRPVIVFMGRLTMQKGADYFINLAHAVLRKIPEALFVVAGNGDMYHQLLFQTARQGLSANVLFSGFVRDAQRELLLERADVFVMPSLSEPFGLVALEAAQRHTPVIISKNSGVSEVLPSARSVDFWDIDAMAREVHELLGKPEQAQQVAAGQLQDMEPVTWGAAAEKLKSIYQQAMGGR
jgi:glycogen synthase